MYCYTYTATTTTVDIVSVKYNRDNVLNNLMLLVLSRMVELPILQEVISLYVVPKQRYGKVVLVGLLSYIVKDCLKRLIHITGN